MKQELKDSLSLSHHISKYPLVFTFLACLFCTSFSQRHQVSYSTMSGTDGAFSLLSAVPVFAIVAIIGISLVGAVRSVEENPLKRGVYITAGFCGLFLCGCALYLANGIVFNLCMAAIAALAEALCIYLYLKQSFVSTALAAAGMLALGMSMGFGFLVCSIAVIVIAVVIMSESDEPRLYRMICLLTVVVTALLVPLVYSSADSKADGVLLAGAILSFAGAILARLRGNAVFLPPYCLCLRWDLLFAWDTYFT